MSLCSSSVDVSRGRVERGVGGRDEGWEEGSSWDSSGVVVVENGADSSGEGIGRIVESSSIGIVTTTSIGTGSTSIIASPSPSSSESIENFFTTILDAAFFLGDLLLPSGTDISTFSFPFPFPFPSSSPSPSAVISESNFKRFEPLSSAFTEGAVAACRGGSEGAGVVVLNTRPV